MEWYDRVKELKKQTGINTKELANRSGIPTSTIRDKMLHPGKIRLSDLAAIDRHCPFTPEEALSLIRRCTA